MINLHARENRNLHFRSQYSSTGSLRRFIDFPSLKYPIPFLHFLQLRRSQHYQNHRRGVVWFRIVHSDQQERNLRSYRRPWISLQGQQDAVRDLSATRYRGNRGPDCHYQVNLLIAFLFIYYEADSFGNAIFEKFKKIDLSYSFCAYTSKLDVYSENIIINYFI